MHWRKTMLSNMEIQFLYRGNPMIVLSLMCWVNALGRDSLVFRWWKSPTKMLLTVWQKPWKIHRQQNVSSYSEEMQTSWTNRKCLKLAQLLAKQLGESSRMMYIYHTMDNSWMVFWLSPWAIHPFVSQEIVVRSYFSRATIKNSLRWVVFMECTPLVIKHYALQRCWQKILTCTKRKPVWNWSRYHALSNTSDYSSLQIEF